MKDRIKEIMKREHLTPSQFAEKTQIQRAALSHILTERNKPSLDVVMKIHNAFSHVNLEWLLYGKGSMMKQEDLFRKEDEKLPDLFDEIHLNTYESPAVPENRREIAPKQVENTPKDTIRQEVIHIEKNSRKITEIRIFFDDNTYEVFKPENK